MRLWLVPAILMTITCTAGAVTLSEIRDQYDAENYSAAVTSLNKLRAEDPGTYESLPFALMYAKSLDRSGAKVAAMKAYEEAARKLELSRFALLPLARIALAQKEPDLAVRSYQQYLTIHEAPEYATAAREALDVCFQMKRPDSLRQTAEIVRQQKAYKRLGEFYIAKSYLLRNDMEQARLLFKDLIAKETKDDITSLALTELDAIEGKNLNASESARRAKLAYKVWNFELTRKYLAPHVFDSMENAYFYARAIVFAGDTDTARKTYEAALAKWPEDKLKALVVYQFANFCLRQGDNVRAAQLYSSLRPASGSEIMENATFNLVQALRSQNKFQEAVNVLRPYCGARKKITRDRALFLRARTLYQGTHYREALTDLNSLLNATGKPSLTRNEVFYWKAMVLEKLEMKEDAANIYAALRSGTDFFALQVASRIPADKAAPVSGIAPPQIRLCRLPGKDQEFSVIELATNGDLLVPFLYLHLYEEASRLLTTVTAESWNVLAVDSTDRQQRLLAITYLAGLGHNYPTATYYSEVFIKTLPAGTRLQDMGSDVLHALFPLPYREVVSKFAEERKVDPYLVFSIMKQESKFKEFARSQAFARGLMQLIPSTAMQIATELGISDFSLDHLYRPDLNINFGTRYVQGMAGKFGNRVEVLAASYNSGESNVRRWLSCTSTDEVVEFYSNIDLPETKTYVSIVKTNYEWYKRVYGSS